MSFIWNGCYLYNSTIKLSFFWNCFFNLLFIFPSFHITFFDSGSHLKYLLRFLPFCFFFFSSIHLLLHWRIAIGRHHIRIHEKWRIHILIIIRLLLMRLLSWRRLSIHLLVHRRKWRIVWRRRRRIIIWKFTWRHREHAWRSIHISVSANWGSNWSLFANSCFSYNFWIIFCDLMQ